MSNLGEKCLSAFILWAGLAVVAPAAVADTPVDFVTQIQPLLIEHCGKCHGDTKQESGYRLDFASELLKGGDNGRAVVPKEPAKGRSYREPQTEHHADKTEVPCARPERTLSSCGFPKPQLDSQRSHEHAD